MPSTTAESRFYDDVVAVIDAVKTDERSEDTDAYAGRILAAARQHLPGDTVTIKYEIHCDDAHKRGTVKVPSWCSGDPKAAVALHFFGYADAAYRFVTKAEVV